MLTIENITFEKAQRILRGVRDDSAEASAQEHAGDFWRKGDGWIGPRVAGGGETGESVMSEIQRGFVSKNCLAEVESRHTAAVIGKEPDWSLTLRRAMQDGEEPTQDEQRLIDEAQSVLTRWWNRREVMGTLQAATAQMLVSDRGPLRLFVPPVYVDEDGHFPLRGSLSEALDAIHLSKPDLFQATVYRDEESQQLIGIYGFRETDDFGFLSGDRLELHGVLTSGEDAGKTIIRILGAQQTFGESQPLQLGGHLGIFEMSRPRLITEQVRQLNALLNMAMTMMGRNVILGGFLERTILGAQLPGEWKEGSDGKKTFTPNPLYVGAGSTNAFSGQPIYEGDGTTITAYTTPNVVYRDPTSCEVFAETKADAYRALLEEVKQLYSLLAGDAVTSAVSRRQSQNDFKASLQPTKIQIERAGRWLLETALAMAAEFSGQPGKFASLRAQFDCQLDLGPISAEDQRVAMELVKAGVIDLSTGMVRIGVADPQAEESKIAARRASLPRSTKRTEGEA